MAAHPLRILLVDDDEDSFPLTRGLLSQVQGACYDLQWRNTYEAGLEALRLSGHDACLLDFRLGARDGLDLLRQAVAEGCRTPIIMLTGQGDHEIDLQAMKAGAADFLDKDRLDASRLERSIRYTVERQQLLEALRKSEARFRRLFEANIVGVFFAETNGRITDANDAFLKIFGHDRGDLPLCWNQQRPFLDAAVLAQLQAAGVAPPREQDYLRKDGKPIPVLVGFALLEGHTDHCICFAVDMRERNHLRDMVKQKEKLAAIGLLAAGIAHEINNPMTVVGNNLVVLERDTKGLLAMLDAYEGTAEQLTTIAPQAISRIRDLAEAMDLAYVRGNLGCLLTRTQDNVHRVGKIVSNLRNLGQTEAPKFANILIADLLQMSLGICRATLERLGITVAQDCPPYLQVYGIAPQISQVLLNLLANAMQAIDAAGRSGDGRIRLTGRRIGAEVLLEVADNGCGIDAKDLPRIFDPFFSTQPVGSGTGLGLALCQAIVSGHNGRIEVETLPGQGSCFRVYLQERQPGAKIADK